MNQLHGKFLNVVLSIEDARGVDFVKHPLHVTANLNGRILESDKVLVGDRASFNTELIWEVDKKDLRKMRSSNHPLRVECISTDPQNRCDRIGFVLLSLRSGQIIALKDAKCPINLKWYKMIGCQADKKKFHPELCLGLTIRDHLINEIEVEPQPLIGDEELIEVPQEDLEFISSFPFKYLDDGYIQIGDDDEELESFSLNLLVKEAKNLDTLLPEVLVFKENNEKFYMTFKIFGIIIKTKPFFKHFHDTFSLNEKVVVRILANETTLHEFLKTQNILITLYSGTQTLGSTQVDLESVTFEEDTSKFFFKLPPPNDIVPFGGDEASPYLEIKCWLQRITESRVQFVPEEKPPTKIVKSNLERPQQTIGFGDQTNSCILDKLEKVDLKSKTEANMRLLEGGNVVVTKSSHSIVKKIALSPRLSKKYAVFDTYVQYDLKINLETLMWRMAPKDKLVIFKFLHPRASNYITIFSQISNEVGEVTDLNNICIKLSYISTADQIENILNAWPPKLVLTDEREKLLSEEYEFDASKFFCDHSQTYKYVAELRAIRSLQSLARLQLNLSVEAREFGDLELQNDFHLTPPIIDEMISVKELADIEKWKKFQKEEFNNRLEMFKQQESERLESFWQTKRDAMETKLNDQMQKCKNLQEQLQTKLDSLKTDKYLERRQNRSNKFEEIFKENWNKYSEGGTKDVIEALSKTERDNEYLRKLVDDQRKEIESLKHTALTKEQTTNLLIELKELERGFEEAQDAKSYFKSQWKKTCDELHEIKSEEYKIVQINLKKSKEELSQLKLDDEELLYEGPTELLTDRSTSSLLNYC